MAFTMGVSLDKFLFLFSHRYDALTVREKPMPGVWVESNTEMLC